MSLDKEVARRGVTLEQARRHGDPSTGEAVRVSLVFDRDFGGTLALRVVNAAGEPLAEAVAEVYRNAGDASDVEFSFSPESALPAKARFVIAESVEEQVSEDAGTVAAPSPSG